MAPPVRVPHRTVVSVSHLTFKGENHFHGKRTGYRAGRTIAAIPGATAVFVGSDEMAFGVIRALLPACRKTDRP